MEFEFLNSSCTFPMYTSTSKEIRDASAKAENALDEYSIQSGMREDMFKAFSAFSDRVNKNEVRSLFLAELFAPITEPPMFLYRLLWTLNTSGLWSSSCATTAEMGLVFLRMSTGEVTLFSEAVVSALASSYFNGM